MSLFQCSWIKLKMNKVKLELISDIDMHLFIEKGMRGGISNIRKRYCKHKKCHDKSQKVHSQCIGILIICMAGQ